ncbi:type II secretion system secretin GspD [Pseudohongiella spirulinae]|uniref:General secretion pathway protein GspD n=1 Tax=Pseudohongiella spirulinae TaxID=1249552 RepID=A0A0S2KFE7_9GAMM|nr:type II secretion system secretin GspD [Pseudohongiella spirulinae]ALO47032.1 general secretion pathway protein GspD [Pseudohongiella spirulinae]
MRASLKVSVLLCVCLMSTVSLAQDELWTPNFRDSDILEVIRAVQDVTGKTMIIDPRVRGQMTVISSMPVDADTYYSIFLRALDVNGFTAVETADNMVSILPTQDVRAAPLPFSSDSNTSSSQYVTEAIQLDNVSVNQVLPVLRPLISQSNGQMSAYPAGNMLVVVDTVANIERVRRILNEIDRSAVPETEVVRLQFANAADIVNLLREMNESPQIADQDPETSRLQVNADGRTNTILVTGGQRQRDHVKQLITLLDQPREQTGNTRVVYLEYANATRVAEVLQSVVRNTYELGAAEVEASTARATPASRYASIEADPDNNALIITADLDIIDSLMDVVSRLDIQRAQVLVEAIIVEINDDVGQNLGIQWLFRDESGAFASSFDAGNNLQQLGLVAEGALNDNRQDGLTSLAAGLASAAGQTIGIGRIGSSTDLLALVDLLQASSGANILSTPNILTTDNTEAMITVGESVPFITGSYTNTGNTGSIDSPFQTINRQNVGTTLRVTPHVNRGDKVALDINQEISSISQKAGAVDLITNERKIETRVTVSDGEIVVLGGLIRDNVIQSETRVPLLGSVPGVGRLFRSTSSSVQKTNLLVFIRPTILRDDAALRGATAEKYQLIRDQQLRQLPVNGGAFGGTQMPVLPPWEESAP